MQFQSTFQNKVLSVKLPNDKSIRIKTFVKMKKTLVTIVVALMTVLIFSAQAQVMDTSLMVKHGRIYMSNHKMSNSDLALLNGFNMDKYRTGRAKYTIGVSMVAVGAVPGLLATYALIQNAISEARRDPYDNRPRSGLGYVIALVSGGTAIVLEGIGIPLVCSGVKNIRDVASDYNASWPVQLSFLPTVYYDENLRPNAGMSLVLRF